MYLKSVRLKNIKCFKEVSIDFIDDGRPRMWTTLFGENAIGKSALLQAIGAALAGPTAVRELLPVAERWVREGESYGEIEAEILRSEDDVATRGNIRTSPYTLLYLVSGNKPDSLPASLLEKPTVAEIVFWSGDGDPKSKERLTKDKNLLQKTAFSEGQVGWLACGYGPFRRLKGGSENANNVVAGERRSARFVTLFMEDAALTNASSWLLQLHNSQRDDPQCHRQLEVVKRAIEERLFPEKVTLVLNSRSALLKLENRPEVRFEDLSDGYRSMLALAIDLLRWTMKSFPQSQDPLSSPGVVLIDELDAHLHPSWQRTIGHWLRDKFPRIQFIVATHSPFLAQVAEFGGNQSDESGTAVSTPIPGNVRLVESADGVIAMQSLDYLRGMGPEQILQTDLFGMPSLLTPPIQTKIDRLRSLLKKQRKQALSPSEDSEMQALATFVENLPAGLSPTAIKIDEILKKAMLENSEKIRVLQ